MWSASAVGRPAFAPWQVHMVHRPSVMSVTPAATLWLRVRIDIIYFRRPLLCVTPRTRYCIHIVLPGRAGVFFFFFPKPKSNKTRSVVDGEESRESLEKSFVTNFERDQLLLPPLYVHNAIRTIIIWKFHWPNPRECRAQWKERKNNNNLRLERRGQQLCRFKAHYTRNSRARAAFVYIIIIILYILFDENKSRKYIILYWTSILFVYIIYTLEFEGALPDASPHIIII